MAETPLAALDLTEFESLISKYGVPEGGFPEPSYESPTFELYCKDEQGNEYPLIINNESLTHEEALKMAQSPMPKLFGPYYREIDNGS